MYKLELTENEVKILIELMNLAVKANGLNVAETALYFSKKIQNSYQKIDTDNVNG